MGPCNEEKGLPAGRYMAIQKAYDIKCYMFGSTRSLGLVGWGRCDQFMSIHGELNLRTAHIINRVRNEVSLEELRSFFCELCQHIIHRTAKKEQFWNMDETGFIQKQNSRKVFL